MARQQPSDPNLPAARIATGLYKLALVLRHQSWKASGQRGLTPTQSQILALLAKPSFQAGLKRVARHLSITMGTASEAVSALERKGLVRKDASPQDGRALVLKLTPAGRAEARRTSEWPEVFVRAADALPAPEQAGLLRGLVGLIRTLQEDGAIPTARMCVGCRHFRPNVAPGQVKAHYCAFLAAPIGDSDLQLDCRDMQPVTPAAAPELWSAFLTGTTFDSADFESAEPD